MITLYFNFTPNRYHFYYYKSDSDYYNMLSEHDHISYMLDNARLVDKVLYVSKAYDSAFDYTQVTYIYENRDGFNRYYFVESCQYFGNNQYKYYLSEDLWANYIAFAQFDHILLQRSNRHPTQLKSGKFDDIPNVTNYNIVGTNNAYINYTPLMNEVDINDIYIAFSVVWQSYNEKQLFGNSITTSDANVFCVKIVDLVKPLSETAPIIPLYYIERAISIICGIYAIVGNKNTDLDAYVSNMYLLHKSMIPNVDNTVNTQFKTAFKDYLKTGEVIASNNGLMAVHNSFITLPFNIPIEPNNVVYIGTKTAMLKLHRVFNNSGNITANIEVIVKKDDIQIIARCGDDQLDISQSLALGVPNSTGATDSLTKIARGVSTVGAFTGAITQGMMGNYAGAGISAFKSGLGIVQESTPNAQYKNNGDGLTSWVKTRNTTEWATVEYPICITRYASANGNAESIKAMRLGASFNQFIDNIDDMFTARPIVAGVENNTVYMQCNLDVENIPSASAEYIASKFNDGIYLVKVNENATV